MQTRGSQTTGAEPAKDLRKALVRNFKDGTIDEITYHNFKSHIYVVTGSADDVPLVRALIGERTTSNAKLDILYNDPDLLKIGERRTCRGCGILRISINGAESDTSGYSLTRGWFKHKIECEALQTILFKERSASNKDQRPEEQAHGKRRVVFREDQNGLLREMNDDSDGVQEHVGDGEDPMEVESEEEVLRKEVPPSRQAVNLEDRRRALLEDCAFSGIVEPRRVYCVVCKVWIGLTNGSYSPGNWTQHLKAKTHRSAKYRRRCVGSFYDDNTTPPSRKPSFRASTRTTMPSRTPAREGGHHRLGILTRLGAATQNNQDAREASGSRPSHDGSAQQASETIQTAPLQPRTANSVSSGPSSASASSNETRRTDGSNPATTAGPRPAEGHVRAETVDGQHRQMNFNVPEGVAHMTISLNFTHV